MILYFSGTGNSRRVAERLASLLEETPVFMPEADPAALSFEGNMLGIVCPVYSWGVSPYILDYIASLGEGFSKSVGDRPVWYVLTCGDETAYAPEILEDALRDSGLTAGGGWSVIMPNDYVLLPGFDVDSKELEERKLDASERRIVEIAERIGRGEWAHDFTRGKMQWLKSRVIFPLFKRWGIFPSRWHWTQGCVGRGRCALVCPVKHIDFETGRPRWGERCVSCTACFHICPAHAVEYGRITTHKRQYRSLLRLRQKVK